jgi:histidyl-tRNA synthetase
MLRRANGQGARICLVLGEAEMEARQVQLKDLGARGQELVPRDAVVQRVIDVLQQPVATGGAD